MSDRFSSDRFSHCAKFARSLALSSTLLACADNSNEPPVSEPTTAQTPAQAPTATAQAPVRSQANEPPPPAPTTADVKSDAPDASDQNDAGAHISGPLPPPELPASFTA